MKKKFKNLPEWEFELDEVSANVYEIVGINKSGHKISFKGLELDELIEQCKKKAIEIQKLKK